MTALAVVSQKGGVGKTTTVVSVGALLASGEGRTLMVDLDPHASLTAYFGGDPDHTDRGSADLFERVLAGESPRIRSLVRPTPIDNLHLVPASTHLATIERRGAGTPGLGLVLRRSLETLQSAGEHFDHVLIDTPPTLGILMVNALAACQRVVIPVQTDFLAIRGLDLVERTLQRVRRSRGWPLPSLVVPTFFDRRTKAARQGLEELQRRYADTLWPHYIPVDSGLRNASAEGKPYPLYNRRGRAAQAYAKLVEDILTYEQGPAGTVGTEKQEAANA